MIICIRRKMSGGPRLEHIVELEWKDTGDGKTGKTSRDGLVKFIDDGHSLFCENQRGGQPARVEVVRPAGRSPYLRTQPDHIPYDNLLELPEYY